MAGFRLCTSPDAKKGVQRALCHFLLILVAAATTDEGRFADYLTRVIPSACTAFQALWNALPNSGSASYGDLKSTTALRRLIIPAVLCLRLFLTIYLLSFFWRQRVFKSTGKLSGIRKPKALSTKAGQAQSSGV